MAIQISEKLLSPKAQKALANAKSKSQLLRDALEFYVSRVVNAEESANSQVGNLHNELAEIKALLVSVIDSGGLAAQVDTEDKHFVAQEIARETPVSVMKAAKKIMVIPEQAVAVKTDQNERDRVQDDDIDRAEDLLSQSLDIFG